MVEQNLKAIADLLKQTAKSYLQDAGFLPKPIPKPDYDINEVIAQTGGPSKVPRGYFTAVSGIDVKVCFEDEDGNWLIIPEIQRVNFTETEYLVEGTIVTILLDGEILKNLPKKLKNMLMIGANEFGTQCYTKFFDISFIEVTCNTCVEDLILEVHTKFIASSRTPWKKPGGLDLDYYVDHESIVKNLKSYV